MCSIIIVAICKYNMPLGKKSYKKSAPRRRRQYRRKPRVFRGVGHVREQAGASYTTNSAPLMPNQPYSFMNFSLSAASSRVVNIGKAYQFFRIKRITWHVRPAYDTFGGGTSLSGASVPNLYWMIDKEEQFNPVTTSLQTLKAAGAKPIRCDDKLITKQFRPAVLFPAGDISASGGAPVTYGVGMKKMSPWLPTNVNAYDSSPTALWNPSTIDHLGLILCIDQDTVDPAGKPAAYVSFDVEFEFKKPLSISNVGDAPTILKVKTETLAPEYVPPEEVLKTAV